MSEMKKKLHNPKSHAPAVYIPCWLIQVPNKLLSYAAKVLYGRLAQWSNESGDVFRSYNQLAQEIGSTQRSVNEYLRELRECGLIATLQPQAGGLNHFVFYDHAWMHEKINTYLSYKSEIDPEQDSALPQAESCSTPKQDSARINKKEIEINKKEEEESKKPTPPPAAMPKEIKLLTKFEISTPKKPNQKTLKFLQRGIDILEEKNISLENYLNYMTCRCEEWLRSPWGEKQRTNDNLLMILKPSIIIDALSGKYEDRTNVKRN